MKMSARFATVADIEHSHEADYGTPVGDATEAYGLLLLREVEKPYCDQCGKNVDGIDGDLGNFLQCEYCGKEIRRV